MAPTDNAPIARTGDRQQQFTAQGEAYSDEEYGGKDIIDLELVPDEMGESAPTGLIRDRSIQMAQDKKAKKAKKVKGEVDRAAARQSKKIDKAPGFNVKDEPMSPPLNPSIGRISRAQSIASKDGDDDKSSLGDIERDVDMDGTTVSGTATPDGDEEPVPAKLRAVDLSESEDEDEEEELAEDFVQEPGKVSRSRPSCGSG